MTDRERLIELICKAFSEKQNVLEGGAIRGGKSFYLASHLADYLLANGVRLPVLCKDCDFSSLWAGDGIAKQGKCFFLIGENQYVTPDGYCSCGTRRADNEENDAKNPA